MECGSREDSAQGEWFVLDSPAKMRVGRRIKMGFAFGTRVGAYVETEGEWIMLVFIFAPTLF